MKNSIVTRLVVGSSLMLSVVALGMGDAVKADNHDIHLVPPAVEERGGLTESELWAEEQESKVDNGSTRVEVYEDGSGVQYINGMEVRTFPSDTFVWDCANMGNRICGPTLPVTE